VLRELHHFGRQLHLWNLAEIFQLISDLVCEAQRYAAECGDSSPRLLRPMRHR
jgi:hypothetical protein